MGLLETGLKAVVAVKTADVIHQRILDRQAAQWAEHGPPGGSRGAAGGSGDDIVDRLTALGELRANGVLTDAEFEVQKARILGA